MQNPKYVRLHIVNAYFLATFYAYVNYWNPPYNTKMLHKGVNCATQIPSGCRKGVELSTTCKIIDTQHINNQ